ncbi:EFR1 family ferrodoxin [Candidatus Omnitrophota bacterium]
MKTTLFYFSATGNSLRIARDLAVELGDAQVIAIPKAITEQEIIVDADRIGIVYPVYAWGMPSIVTRFIEKLKANSGAYIFAIANFGGMAGGALKQTADQLALKGIGLSAGFGIQMPGNYAPLYGAIPEERQKKMFQKEQEKIKHIAQVVKEGNVSRVETSFFLINLIFSNIIYKIFTSKLAMMDTSFWADENCNSCGICKKVCPVGNIEIVEGKPVWLHKCEQCVACLQWCPKEAIQFKKSTIGRKRYRHPTVTVDDFLLCKK